MNKYILSNIDVSKEMEVDLAIVYHEIKEQERLEQERLEQERLEQENKNEEA